VLSALGTIPTINAGKAGQDVGVEVAAAGRQRQLPPRRCRVRSRPAGRACGTTRPHNQYVCNWATPATTGDVVAPCDRAAAVVGLLHGNVRHEAVGSGAVAVVLTRLEEHAVARGG
jgi:hypothetical protein